MTANEQMNELINAVNNLTAEVRKIVDILRCADTTNENAKTYRSLCANSSQSWRLDEGALGGVSGCPSDIYPFANSLCPIVGGRRKPSEEFCRKCWDQPYNGGVY